MKTVRVKMTWGPFIRGQKCLVVREDKYGLFLKGCALNRADWKEEVVHGPYQPHEVEEYVPEVPLKPLEERVKEVWP